MIDKLQKLLAHERSAREIGNIAEAAAFASKIQELLFAHKLTMSDIEIAEEDRNEPVDQEYVEAESWSTTLGTACANSTFCRVLRNGKSLIFIGNTSNRQSCISMFQHLAVTGKALAETETAAWKQSDDYAYKTSIRSGFARTWKRSWLAGYADAIYNRLVADRKTLEANVSAGSALVYIDRSKQAVDTFVADKYPTVRRVPSARTNIYGSAYRSGFQSGFSVSLKSRASLTA